MARPSAAVRIQRSACPRGISGIVIDMNPSALGLVDAGKPDQRLICWRFGSVEWATLGPIGHLSNLPHLLLRPAKPVTKTFINRQGATTSWTT